MLSRASSVKKPAGAVPVAPPAAPAKRFELPVLDFNFASLTDGTNIPPPLPSPIQEEETFPTTPNGSANKTDAKTGHLTANGTSDPTSPKSNMSKSSTGGGLKRAAEDGPASPTLSNRPGSIRRLFSRNLLNNAYANGESPADGVRPPSRSATSVADSRKVKRSSGWFSRWTGGGDNKRASIAVPPSAESEKKPTGPPPPMIPEIAALKSKLDIKDDADFGSDLFKNIK